MSEPDIDLIVLTDPRSRKESTSTYNHDEIKQYKKYVKDDTVVVQRINECDERKNTNFVNKYLIEANKIADYTIFVSNWLKNLYTVQGINRKNNYVILAGANNKIFNSN